jgi:peptide/nickel transport system substrate-binding protein
MSDNYWNSPSRPRGSRRTLLAGGGSAAVGITALLAGCSSSNNNKTTTKAAVSGASGSPRGAAPAAGGSPAALSPRPGGTIRMMGPSITAGLDIHRITGEPIGAVWAWAANFLVRFSAKSPYQTEPDLAASLPEIPGDGTVLTFKIRPEAKWQNRAPVNGRQVTAEDIKATFERIKDPAVASPRAGNYSNVDTITAIDPQTVQFKLKAPQADLLAAMGDQYDFIMPKEVATRGPDAIKTEADVIGSGPYELVTYAPLQRIEMKKRSDGYWKPNTAWVDSRQVLEQPDGQQEANALRAGQIDAIEVTADLVKTFEGDKNFASVGGAGSRRECVMINQNKDPYKDPRVRQAIWRAVDRKQVYDTVFGGAGKPGGPMGPGVTGWTLSDAELAKLPGFGARSDEIKAAKQLLSAAGYPNGFEDTNISFTLSSANVVADVVTSNLADVGIKLKTDIIDGGDLSTRLAKRNYTLSVTLFLSGAYPDAQLYIYHHTGPAGSRNYGDYGTPELDAKLDKQRTMYDYNQRLALVKEIQTDIINNPGPAWIGSRVEYRTFASKVHGLLATPFFARYNDAENAWLS